MVPVSVNIQDFIRGFIVYKSLSDITNYSTNDVRLKIINKIAHAIDNRTTRKKGFPELISAEIFHS